jgi:predicted ferric reductase
MKIYDIIKILGILTLSFLTLTFILGFFKINIPNRFQIHKWSGIITLILGLIHGFIVFYITYLK